jgi:MFS superfamily sulfate permease-like transporter
MNEIWLSIKAWTQRLILAALVIYAGLFIYKNNSESVKFWFWFDRIHSTTVFLLSAGAFAAGIVFAILVSTALKTVKQIRDLRSRGRQEKIERDVSDMKAKAAMLQTRPVGSGEGVTIQVDKLGDQSGR